MTTESYFFHICTQPVGTTSTVVVVVDRPEVCRCDIDVSYVGACVTSLYAISHSPRVLPALAPTVELQSSMRPGLKCPRRALWQTDKFLTFDFMVAAFLMTHMMIDCGRGRAVARGRRF